MTTEEQVLVKNAICPGASDLEFQLCLTDARHRRLDPIKKQIWFIPRWNKNAENPDGTVGRKVWVPQVSIDGLRHIAARDHRDYGSEDDPEFGPIKKISWKVSWTDKKTHQVKSFEKSIMAPEWARVSLWKKGADRPTVATVYWDEIYPEVENAPLVQRMPRLMLAKCASAQANRKAYPETGGLYIPEEFYGQPPDFSPGGRHLLREKNVRTISASIEAEVERQKAGAIPSPQKRIGDDLPHAEAPKPPTAPPPGKPGKPPEVKQDRQFLGVVTLDWTGDESSPVLRGDIANLTPLFQKHCHMSWAGDWWHCEPRDREAIKQICEECGPYQFIEILPKADQPSGGFIAPASSVAASARPLPPENPAAQGRGSRPQSAPAPAAELLKCKIERSIAGMNGQTPVRDVTVLTTDKKKPTYRCYNKDYFEAFDKGLGQEALLVLKRNKSYTNIERPIRIGSKTWDENGVAEIQKDREAGQRTLY